MELRPPASGFLHSQAPDLGWHLLQGPVVATARLHAGGAGEAHQQLPSGDFRPLGLNRARGAGREGGSGHVPSEHGAACRQSPVLSWPPALPSKFTDNVNGASGREMAIPAFH